jgi:hypothetical protein
MTALNSTGSTLASTTYESAIHELVTRIVRIQAVTIQNPEAAVIANFQTDSSGFVISYDFSIPLTFTGGTSSSSFTARNPFVGVTWTDGGDVVGGNYVQALFNLLLKIENFEIDVVRNPTNERRLSLSMESDPWRCSASMQLPCAIDVNTDGSQKTTVQTYLV